VRLAPLLAGGLAVAAAAMAAVAFTTGDGDAPQVATPAPAADRSGLDVWVEHGCGGCHTLAAANAKGTLGPDLTATLKGMPAAYVEESIVAPGAAATAGYDAGMMPEDYASRIPPDDLDRLVTFLLQSAAQ
jgi:cytochrome c oxidase subunit 2